MVMIVMYHYVVNSGLNDEDGPLSLNGMVPNSIYLWLFGMWGKVGINCFMMITGYYMCMSQITFKKVLKLLLQIYFYKFTIYFLFLAFGYEIFSLRRLASLISLGGLDENNFLLCFLVFYLTIPFWNILVHHMTKRQHLLLLLLLLSCYTLLGSIPGFKISYNYVTWFGIIFLIASFIRIYPLAIYNNQTVWGG